MSEHEHKWIKSNRTHKRREFFFVYCACNPNREFQATEKNGKLHVFDTSVDRGGASTVVTARLSKKYIELLKKSNKTTRRLLEESLDKC